jgi:2-polyprenyl-3-methyl-5-hydroxy-6-metoxy-1,4-benzoquinol methylase
LHESWNHNLHYHRVIIDVIAPDCQRALDVGCGQGALTRRLRPLVPEVTGMDRDERSIALARTRGQARFPDIGYVQADFLAETVKPGSFDLVTAVASLHHMNAEAALRKMADVLRPGGVLVIIGLARDLSLTGAALIVPAMIGSWMHRAADALSRLASAPAAEIAYQSPVVWPPGMTYRQVRRLAGRVLPGGRYRRRLYWRYSLVWHKPGED